MIHTRTLTKRYGDTLALDRLSLEIPPGAVFGLLGPNGAGKTTFLRLVMGLAYPDQGEINYGGLAPFQIGYLPERAFYPSRFAIRDYLLTLGRLSGLGGSALRRRVDELLGQVNLLEVAGRRLSACSRGMLQRFGLAQALLADPPLLLLDEPVLGLDPAGQKFMREQIVTLHQAGKTVLLSSHHLDEVTRVCSHVAVLRRGQLVRSGALDAILGPRAQVLIDTGPLPETLRAQLVTLAPGVTAAEGRVALIGEATAQKSEVLRLLLDHQVDIRHLAEQHATLEEVFLEATGE